MASQTKTNGKDEAGERVCVREQDMSAREKLTETARQAETLEKHLLSHYKHHYTGDGLGSTFYDAIAASPLIAAIVAPLSTLYDIPALTQRWYTLDGAGTADPAGNLALSAIGLAFNAIANGFLVLRFSASQKWRKSTVYLSTICWVIKMIIAIVNLGLYGAGSRNGPGFAYATGFWCAVLSAILASLIAVILVIYAIFARANHWTGNNKVQVQGRHFVLSELGLFCFIAVWALIFSRIESWDYFSAIYFCIVTTLTVGFGDYEPTHASTRILTFPFALIAIAALASQVGEIISYFSDRAKTRKSRWRALYEKREQTEYHKLHPTDELIAEMEFLQRITRQENTASRVYDLILSLFCFAIFWCIGALAFSKIEGWDYGTALYFSYVFFLTIGYGDETPETPAGKVFFVIYALIAVPVVASFAIQTVSGIWQASQERRLEETKVKRGLMPKLDRHATISVPVDSYNRDEQMQDPNAEIDDDDESEISINPFVSHMELVVQGHLAHRGQYEGKTDKKADQEKRTLYERRRTRSRMSASGSISNQSSAEKAMVASALTEEPDAINENDTESLALESPRQRTSSGARTEYEQEKRTRAEERAMLDELLIYAIRLEEQARKIILDKLDPGSRPRLLLQADKNVMDRTVDILKENGEEAIAPVQDGPLNDLEEIHIYRESYARMLVAASRLKGLQGQDQLLFERRRGRPYVHGEPVDGGEDCGVPELVLDDEKHKKPKKKFFGLSKTM